MITLFKHGKYKPQGERLDIYDPEELAEFMQTLKGKTDTSPLWSPSLYKPGIAERGTKQGQWVDNYALMHLWEASHFLVVDVDNGRPMEEAKSLVSNLTHVISPSHGNNPESEVDKYRLILWSDVPAPNKEDFKQTGLQWCEILNGDTSKANGGSRFFGCGEPYSINSRGTHIKWMNAPKLKKIKRIKTKGTVPTKVIRVMSDFEQLRQKTGRPHICFWVGCELGRSGLSEAEAEDLVVNSNLGRNMLNDKERNYTEAEIRRQTSNGVQTGRGG